MTALQPSRAPSGLPTFDNSKLRSGEVRILATTASLPVSRTARGFAAAVIDEGANEYDVPAGLEHVLVFTVPKRDRVVNDLHGRRVRSSFPPRSLTVVPAGQPTYWKNETAGGRMIHLHLSPSTVAEWCGNAGGKDELRPVLGKPDLDLRRCFETLGREMLVPAVGSPTMIEALALEIAVRVRRKYAVNLPTELAKGGLAPWQLRQATEFLQDHLGDDVSIEELARITDLSRYHFMRAFKQSTGKTLVQTLIDLRVEKAREMLENTNLPVSEIAAQVGYDAPQAFARVFRRETGIAPSQYRRELSGLSS